MKSFTGYLIIILRLVGVAAFLCFIYAQKLGPHTDMFVISFWVTIISFVLSFALWLVKYFFFDE